MADRRVDRIERCLRDMGRRARFQQLLEAIRAEEGNPDLSYQAIYIAIQMENQRLDQVGEQTKFVTSREGEKWGWVRLREENDLARTKEENEVEALIKQKNESVGGLIRDWLQEDGLENLRVDVSREGPGGSRLPGRQDYPADSRRGRRCTCRLQARNHRGASACFGETLDREGRARG